MTAYHHRGLYFEAFVLYIVIHTKLPTSLICVKFNVWYIENIHNPVVICGFLIQYYDWLKLCPENQISHFYFTGDSWHRTIWSFGHKVRGKLCMANCFYLYRWCQR